MDQQNIRYDIRHKNHLQSNNTGCWCYMGPLASRAVWRNKHC